jgi:phenylpropionate dioxygenase-like ring-hydroxylating dioxygenase large terminal subunit
VRRNPVGLTRFGQQFVFWRSNGRLVCMPDRCPHRGAALSLGRIKKASGTLACPFHGLEFAADGRCVRVPVDADPRLPEDFGVATLPVREGDGYIWMWRGAGPARDAELPSHPDTVQMRHGDAAGTWNAHYTRCIENVCDFSHLPFVHRTTIGMLPRETITRVEMEDVAGGFRAHLLDSNVRKQTLEFLYPNRWLLKLSSRIMLGLVFAPIDSTHTAVYGRTYYGFPMPGLGWFMDAYTRLSQFLVFREDWPIVASQTPGDVLLARDEKLLPSDAPIIAYRKLHRAHEGASAPANV